ncbi:MAG: phage tail protein [Rubrivivax sp.]|nr:phage tail protein [Rubrivivax sp.]
MATDQRNDPYRGFNFVVEIDGIARAGFSEAGGLTMQTDATDYREGTDLQNSVRKLPALSKPVAITLKRGITQDKTLWAWWKNILNGTADRRNVTIVLLNERREAVLRWHAESAWISKIEGPALKASGNEVAMESVELTHEGVELEM